jgi:coenzyme F420-reducing hydrogenase delta subunit
MSFGKRKIACFICKWAFSEEKSAPSKTRKLDVNIVRTPCVGGLDPDRVLEAFIKGADGVLMVGCSPSDCHFIVGSVYSEFTVAVLKKLLVMVGLEPERLQLHLTSPIEETKFTRVVEDFAAVLEKLGPSPLAKKKPDASLLENALAAKNAVADFRLRAYIGKELELTKTANVYGERFSQDEFNASLDKVVTAEFIRQKILLLAKRKPFSVKELAQVLNMKPNVVFRHVLNMRRRGMIALEGTEGTTPIYKATVVQ